MRLEAAHLGDLLRISVRTGVKTPRGPLPDFQGPRGDHGHRRSERCSSRSRPYLPASGFQGRTTLTEKRELFPDPPAASPGSFRLPGRGTRQRTREGNVARLRAPNTRERFHAGFRNTDRIPFRPKTRSRYIGTFIHPFGSARTHTKFDYSSDDDDDDRRRRPTFSLSICARVHLLPG